MKEMAELAAKAVSCPPNFDEGDCEDLRVEDFSSDEEETPPHIQVSIGQACPMSDKTNLHV